MRMRTLAIALTLAIAFPLLAQTTPDWVKRSNEDSAILLKVLAEFAPEAASRFGVEWRCSISGGTFSAGNDSRNLR